MQALGDYLAVGGVLGKHAARIFKTFNECEVTNVVANLDVPPLPHEQVLELEPLGAGFNYRKLWNLACEVCLWQNLTNGCGYATAKECRNSVVAQTINGSPVAAANRPQLL